MVQEHQRSLAIISISHDVGSQLSHDDIIHDFESKGQDRQEFRPGQQEAFRSWHNSPYPVTIPCSFAVNYLLVILFIYN